MKSLFSILHAINPISRISHIVEIAKDVNILSTIYWNFRFFPWQVARKLPVYIGYNVDIMHFERGNVTLSSDAIKRGMIKIGITSAPTFPSNGLHTLIRFHGNSSITFGRDVVINKGCSVIATYGGNIQIGDDVFINQYSLIYCNSSVKIGNYVSIGWSVQIYDTAVHYMVDINTGQIKNPAHPVIISDNVWICNHATISAGAKIPPSTVVSAHSLVNKDFMGVGFVGGMLYGTPAKYKQIDKVRIENYVIENQLKWHYFGEKKLMQVNITDLGYELLPRDGGHNVVHRHI